MFCLHFTCRRDPSRIKKPAVSGCVGGTVHNTRVLFIQHIGMFTHNMYLLQIILLQMYLTKKCKGVSIATKQGIAEKQKQVANRLQLYFPSACPSIPEGGYKLVKLFTMPSFIYHLQFYVFGSCFKQTWKLSFSALLNGLLCRQSLAYVAHFPLTQHMALCMVIQVIFILVGNFFCQI